jgi:hypothetical protein
MIDINKEAEELFPINSTNGSMEMLSRHQLNNVLKQEGFIAGYNSKATQAKVIQAQIDILTECGYDYRDAIIKKLQQQLKELENEI